MMRSVVQVLLALMFAWVGVVLLRRDTQLTEHAVRSILASSRWRQFLYPLQFDRAGRRLTAVRVTGVLALLTSFVLIALLIESLATR